MDVVSKLPDTGTTIFTIMSKMAADNDAINLSQGYPDFAVPAPLVDALDRYVREGMNQYPPMHGVACLREQIAAKILDCYDVVADPENEITVTSGATEALFVAIQALVGSGDEVIVFDPAYDSYEPAVTLAGGTTIHLPLVPPDFHIDWDQVRATITPRTRMIIVNTPHNPTGAVMSEEDLDQLAALVDGTRIAVVADEVYEHMVFDGRLHRTMFSHPGLERRSMVVSSFGKTLHATGWKVGYCIASPALTTEFRKVHQYVTFTTHTPSQWAIADFLEHHPDHYRNLAAFYQAKRDLLARRLIRNGFSLRPSAGTYFQLADYSNLSDEDDMTFVTRLTERAGVAAIPVSVFYETPPAARLVRFCFAKEDDTLTEAARRIRVHFN